MLLYCLQNQPLLALYFTISCAISSTDSEEHTDFLAFMKTGKKRQNNYIFGDKQTRIHYRTGTIHQYINVSRYFV